MNSVRTWLFRGSIIVAVALMLISWFSPWWNAEIDQVGDEAVQIYPYGLHDNMGSLDTFIKGSDMPAWFAPLVFTYLGVNVILLLYSVFRLKDKKTKWILVGVGGAYVIFAACAMVFASFRAKDFGMPALLGHQYIFDGPEGPIYADGTLLFGYYLALATGLLCILLGLLRSKILPKNV
jgi:hypothetical protein